MAEPRGVNNGFNPYHYSYGLCAQGGSISGQQQADKRQFNSKNDGPQQKQRRRMPGYEHYLVTAADFYCDRCDRSFNIKSQYDSHVAEHITCGREGCQFTAHPKVVENHVKMQHLTGLYQKIGKLSNSEEITKWIAERKKNYPSVKNISNKEALEAVKTKRGERVKPETGQFSSSLYKKNRKPYDEVNKQRRNHPRVGKNRSRKARERKPFFKKPRETIKEADCEKQDWNGCIPPFRGTGSLVHISDTEDTELPEEVRPESCVFTDEEEDSISTQTEPLPSCSTASEPVNRSLGLLMASYGTDDSDDDGPPREVKTIRSKSPPPPVQNNPEKQDNVSEKCSTYVKTNQKQDKVPRKMHHNEGPPQRNSANRNQQGREYVRRARKPTLLERLLQTEIIQERNVILQCVRYVAQNNFFDAPKTIEVKECEE